MKITVFTSNQPRHIALVERLTRVADEVFAVLECNTVFPGQIADFFAKSATMQQYFRSVMEAEQHFFGDVRFAPQEARVMSVKSGDLNFLSRDSLQSALEADTFIVFGSSFIQGWLVEELVLRQAINIHMGLSPYYRGSSCNFWALYDANPSMVGATIHLLSRGLDSGPMLSHAVPKFDGEDPFHFTMKAVVAAQEALVETLRNDHWRTKQSVQQNRSLEIRYSRNADFTDDVVSDFLSRRLGPSDLSTMFESSALPALLNAQTNAVL